MRRLLINPNNVGLCLMGIYIFLGYNATGIILPTSLNSLALFVFLAYGAIYVLCNTKKIRLSTYTAWYIVFIFASLITMVYSPEKEIFSGQFYLMMVSLIVTFFYQVFVTNEKSFCFVAWMYSLSSAAMVIMLIMTGNMIADADNRLGSDLMGNANAFATVVMIAVMFALWLIVYRKSNMLLKAILLISIALDYIALIFSAGRKYVIVPIVFLYILLLLKKNKQGRRNVLLYTVVIALLVLGFFYLIYTVPIFYETIGYRMKSFEVGTSSFSERVASDELRAIMQKVALERWWDRPFWGYGFDSFKYYNVGVTGKFFYSHCNFTELLYNGGIFYFLIYYWVYYKTFKSVLINKQTKTEYRAFSIAVIISILVLEYGAITYSVSALQILLSLSLSALSFLDEF